MTKPQSLEKKMKTKLLLAVVMATICTPALAEPPTEVPEPSTIGLFAAAAIAIAIAAKLKK